MKNSHLLGIALFALFTAACGTTPLGSSSEWLQLTLEQLAYYDGSNGKDAYVAVSGDIYDVTDAEEWSNGWHAGMHLAGTDATITIQSAPHGTDVLEDLPLIGELVESSSSSISSSSEASSVLDVTSSESPITTSSESSIASSSQDLTSSATSASSSSSTTTSSSAATTSSASSSSQGLLELTLAQLAYYNGDNGKPAYVAVSGKIYDVTNAPQWNNGWHKGHHYAGTDATSQFPHAMTIFAQNGVPQIGILIAG